MRKPIELALLLALAAAPAVAAPEIAELRAQEAGVALVRGDVGKAIELYGAALSETGLTNERRALILTDRGVAYFRSNKLKLAIEDFNKAAQLLPENSAVYNNRGNVLVALALHEEAIKDFNRAILLSPGYAVAFNNRANVFFDLRRYDQALADFSTAYELNPQSAAPLVGRGRAQLAMKRPYLALRDLSRAISLDQKLAATYQTRAEAQREVENHAAAIEDLSRAVAFDPGNVDLFLARGRAYFAASNFEAAERDFSTAIELNPKSSIAYAQRGLARTRQSAFDDAMSDYNKAFQLDQKDMAALVNRASTFRQMEQADAGLKDIERALKVDPNNAEALKVRGQLLEALERTEAAIADYRKAVTLDPRQREAWEALERLAGEQRNPDQEIVSSSIPGWRVFQRNDGSFFAANDAIRTLKVPLEMLDSGTPKLTAWEEQLPPFTGMGVLRYEGGIVTGKEGPELVELAVIIDATDARVVGIELHKRGAQTSQWQWQNGRLTVAAIDGLTSEYQVRETRPEQQKLPRTATDTRRRETDIFDNRNRDWVPWEKRPPSYYPDQRQSSRPQKPKSLFDMLFKF